MIAEKTTKENLINALDGAMESCKVAIDGVIVSVFSKNGESFAIVDGNDHQVIMIEKVKG